MSVYNFQQGMMAGAAGAAGGYTIDQSIRFNDDDSAYLTRTPGSASSHTTFTFSMWVKRCRTGSMRLFSTALGTSNKEDEIYFESNDRLQWQSYNGGFSYGFRLLSQAVYRDFSAWMHIVAVLDSTNGTAADRQRLYVNGERITAFAAEVQASASYASSINNTQAHYFSRYYASAVDLFDGYMAEIHFIDGQALDPSSFGKVNSTTGQWVPIEYTGTYGTNGFYITGEDSADLGADYSGNGNDFTSSGLTSADQMLDTPTDNYSIFNPVASCNVSGQPLTISDGNLRTSAGGTSNSIEAITQIGPSSGKWYAEFTLNAAPQLSNQYPVIGVIAADLNITSGNNIGNSTFRGYVPNGNTQGTGSGAYGDTFTTNDIIGCAIDLDNQKIWWSKNGVFQNSGDPAAGTNAAFTNLTAGLFYRFCISHAGSTATDVTGNFGQSAFTYTPPTGFNAVSTANLPDPTIADPSARFQTTLYTGNGTAIGSGGNAVDQSGNRTFQPDFVWIKRRNSVVEHVLTDAVRGVTKELSSNDSGVEETVAEGLTTFGSSGFTVGSDGSYNTNTGTYAAWQWKANGSGSSNTDGSITSTVSANPTSGFSIVTYTGNGVAATIGHGLGITPKMVIVRERSPGGDDWYVYHVDLPSASYALNLNTTAAQSGPSAAYWNSTAPTSSVFSLGTSLGVNQNTATYVAYCFAEVEGFSKFGSYTGTNGGNPFIYTGFQPAFLLVKSTSSGRSWVLADNMRGAPYNPVSEYLIADTTAATGTTNSFDLLSNGFRVISSADQFYDIDASGHTFIYAAFAESPFKTANAR